MAQKVVKVIFDEDSPLAAEFIKWFSNQGEQGFADHQISEGFVNEGDEPVMGSYDHANHEYVDFRTATDTHGYPLRRSNDNGKFEGLSGDDLISALSGDAVEYEDED